MTAVVHWSTCDKTICNADQLYTRICSGWAPCKVLHSSAGPVNMWNPSLLYLWIQRYTYFEKRSLQWSLRKRDGVSNHRRLECLLNRLFRSRSKKTPKLRVTGLFRGIHRWPMGSPHTGPVMRKMLPFDDVIMFLLMLIRQKTIAFTTPFLSFWIISDRTNVVGNHICIKRKK